MQKTLRPYQLEALTKLRQRLKETTHPLLVNASVGSGKSLIIAELLLIMERAGFRALCLTMNSTLIQQNADTYQFQGGNPGVYCAGLDAKDTENLVIFASPHSVCQDIRNKGEISRKPFKLIVVDEAHNICPHNEATMFRRIINHYGFMAQQEQYSFRIVGLTGTPYRGKGISIIGENEFFKEQVCEITTSWLIEQGYLTKPYFGLTTADSIDFSECRPNSMGKFNTKDLEIALAKNERLTGEIMRELQTIKCNGIFIFASTKKHCEECARSLPDGQWAIITGDTKHEERKDIIAAAREGRIRYLLSVSCLYVGIDIPFYDVCAWLRPTESLVIYTQGIGRVLRLHEEKTKAIILDYAGNLERHGDIDDPIINEALQPRSENEKDYVIPCYTCGTQNTIHSRRCIGVVDNKRCEHYFEFKDCTCGTKNDITSRHCRECQAELIDPNAKLTRIKPEQYTLNVIEATYSITPQGYTSNPIINIAYRCDDGVDVYEHYYTNTQKSKNITYAKLIRPHLDKASDYYMHLSNIHKMREFIAEETLKTPSQLVCTKNEDGFYRIMKKVF